MAEKPTVFVIDDDVSVRRGLSRLLRSAGFDVESHPSAESFLDRERYDGVGCIVLDLKMPALSGTDLQERLGKADYSMPIIFVSAHGDIPTSVTTVKKGAVDFLTKPVEGEQLLEAVRNAVAQDASARERHAEASALRERLETLSAREHEVLTWVITGALNKQIADALSISEKTVKHHRGRITEKLGIQSVAELVRFCQTVGVEPAAKAAP